MSFMDELFEMVKKEGKEQNPLAKTTKSHLSEPTSKKQEKTAEGTLKLFWKTRETIGQKGTSGNTECKEERSGAA